MKRILSFTAVILVGLIAHSINVNHTAVAWIAGISLFMVGSALFVGLLPSHQGELIMNPITIRTCISAIEGILFTSQISEICQDDIDKIDDVLTELSEIEYNAKVDGDDLECPPYDYLVATISALHTFREHKDLVSLDKAKHCLIEIQNFLQLERENIRP